VIEKDLKDFVSLKKLAP